MRQLFLRFMEDLLLLKYIWMVIQDLFLAVTFVTLIHAVLHTRFGARSLPFLRVGIGIGILSSIILAVVKNTTNKIVSSRWNHSIYAVIIAFTLFLLLFSLLAGRAVRTASGTIYRYGTGAVLLCMAGAGLSAVWIFYSLPGAIAYPFTFNTMGNGYLSWFFFQRLIGWVLGFLILLIYSRLLYICACQIKNKGLPMAVLLIGSAVAAFYCVCRFFVPWVNRAKWLGWPVRYDAGQYGWAGRLVKIGSRYSMSFIWVCAALVLLLLIVFFAENTKITDPYDNPAQCRKLRARGRSHRRLAVGLLVFLAMNVLSMSVIKAYDTREVVLSAPETFTVEEDRILVPMEAVSDGHLHRFEYTTENGVNVRWIVVKKPGSASFGVGLDACEVCGNAGYYERNGQVICKRCDVVMNIHTIGFKGGCNPIPLSYEADGGNLIFSLEDLLAGEKEFR